jgi:hypothetical protein
LLLLIEFQPQIESNNIGVITNNPIAYSNATNLESSTNFLQAQFYENLGQLNDSNILFYGLTPNGILGFGISEISYWTKEVGYRRIQFEGAKVTPPIGLDEVQHRTNYFLGGRGTFTNVRGYSSLLYPELWPKISLICKETSMGPQFEFEFSPGFNVNNEYFRQLKENLNQIWHAVIFQEDPRDCRGPDYYINSQSEVDTLLYSTYVGGTERDVPNSITADSSGNVYVTGETSSLDFPTVNAYDRSYNGEDEDIFIFKLNAEGNNLVYSTFIGGSERDYGKSITVDSQGNAYVTGWTESSNFPVKNGFDETFNDNQLYSDCFVLKLNASGNGLLYSTFIGGTYSDYGYDLELDEDENVYVVGVTSSVDFPVVNGYDMTSNGNYDCFVFKLNSSGTGIIYASYIGGSGSDRAYSIAIDTLGDVFLTGHTESPDFPTVNAYDSSYNGGGRAGWYMGDCFVSKLNPSGNELLYSTYMGGSDGPEIAYSIDVDLQGNTYVTGWTESSDFPTLDAYDDTLNGSRDCFVFKLNSSGETLVYSTYIGGKERDAGNSICVEPLGHVTICGVTFSSDFPTLNAYDETFNYMRDCFLVQLNPDGSHLELGTYIGGSQTDSGRDVLVHDSIIYVSGSTSSADFPTFNAYDDSYPGYLSFCCFVLALRDIRDFDDDGLINYDESQLGTNLYNNDTDHDSLDDYSEVHSYGTDPTSNDSDGDSMPDSWELLYNFDPLNSSDAAQDSDSDGLTNLEEFFASTNPHNSDTDEDGISDGWEVAAGYDPLNAEIPLSEILLYNLPLIVTIIGILASVPILYTLDRYLQQRRKKKQAIEEAERIRRTLEGLEKANEEEKLKSSNTE